MSTWSGWRRRGYISRRSSDPRNSVLLQSWFRFYCNRGFRFTLVPESFRLAIALHESVVENTGHPVTNKVIANFCLLLFSDCWKTIICIQCDWLLSGLRKIEELPPPSLVITNRKQIVQMDMLLGSVLSPVLVGWHLSFVPFIVGRSMNRRSMYNCSI